jgi:hypothetical protein
MCGHSTSENVLHPLAVKNSPFSQSFFVTFEEFFGVNDGNSLFNDNV